MPKLLSSSDRVETKQEALLRATLSEYAPANVNLEKGRAAVAERLASMCQQTQPSKRSGLRLLPRSIAYGSPWWRSFYGLVAIAIFTFLLLGAGVGTYFWGGPFGDTGMQRIGDQHLYSDIGLRQQVGPVAITVTKAYADKSRTLIAYDMQLPASMAGRYSSIIVIAHLLTDHAGEEAVEGRRECTMLVQDGGPIHCVMTLASFHPATKVSQLALSWTIMQISLVSLSQPTKAEIMTGHWNFQFTIPFYADNRGPGGATPLPTPLP